MSHHAPTMPPRARGIVNHNWRVLAELPPPADHWRFADVDIDRSILHIARSHDLILIAGRDGDHRTYRTHPMVWAALVEIGAVDPETGDSLVDCGDDGPLPCGSSTFRNVGGELVCKVCGEAFPRAEVGRV